LEKIIDKQGYAAQELILKELAFHLRELLRTSDILGRLHDDKFVIILPQTTLENAQVVAGRILKLLPMKKVLVEGQKISLKLKLGMAMLDFENDFSIGNLVYKAYKAFTSIK